MERGPLCSGRALGTQNTFQNVIYAATPPLAGAVVAGIGFPALFALSAVFPAVALAVAAPATPNGATRRWSRETSGAARLVP